MTFDQYAAIAIFAGAYVLIATERVHRVAAAMGGAGLMLALRLIDGETAYRSEEAGIDWNVIFLLLGMMMIVGVIKQTGLFEYMAIAAAQRAKGRPYYLMVLLVVITALASALLDNVTTVLLIVPVTFLVCDRLDLPVVPFLIAEVLASNIGGTATLIGDPPNIIIASRADLTFNDFILNLAPAVVILMLAFLVVIRFMFRKSFIVSPDHVDSVMAMSPRAEIKDGVLLVKCMVVLALVLAGFIMQTTLHLEPSVVALLGAGVLLLITKVTTYEALAEVEWETLAFFGGLFVMVGALVDTGVIEKVAEQLADASGGKLLLATVIVLLASFVLSGLVDNIPYVAAMSPIVANLVADFGSDGRVLWWALALGSDLGGNATAVGASANVVVLGIAAKRGAPISFWEFTKYGLVVTALSMLITLPYLWLRYFVLA
ncbi:MAG: ArsB/NhaD family transporter [Aeromicrobium sp.]